jgi:hypothetical protein
MDRDYLEFLININLGMQEQAERAMEYEMKQLTRKGKHKVKHPRVPKWPVKPKTTCWKGYKPKENTMLIMDGHTSSTPFHCSSCGEVLVEASDGRCFYECRTWDLHVCDDEEDYWAWWSSEIRWW